MLLPEAGTPWSTQHFHWASFFLPWSRPVGISKERTEDKLARRGPLGPCTTLISHQLPHPDHNFQVTFFLWTPGPHQCLIIMSSHISDLFQPMHFATQFPPAAGGKKSKNYLETKNDSVDASHTHKHTHSKSVRNYRVSCIYRSPKRKMVYHLSIIVPYNGNSLSHCVQSNTFLISLLSYFHFQKNKSE